MHVSRAFLVVLSAVLAAAGCSDDGQVLGEASPGGASGSGGSGGASGSGGSGGTTGGTGGVTGGTGGATGGTGGVTGGTGGAGGAQGAGRGGAGGAGGAGGSSSGQGGTAGQGTGGSSQAGGGMGGDDCSCVRGAFVPVCGVDGETYDAACGRSCVPVDIACDRRCPCDGAGGSAGSGGAGGGAGSAGKGGAGGSGTCGGGAIAPTNCACFDDTQCGANTRCYGANCALGLAGQCRPAPPSGCLGNRDCPSGQACRDAHLAACLTAQPDTPGTCVDEGGERTQCLIDDDCDSSLKCCRSCGAIDCPTTCIAPAGQSCPAFP